MYFYFYILVYKNNVMISDKFYWVRYPQINFTVDRNYYDGPARSLRELLACQNKILVRLS